MAVGSFYLFPSGIAGPYPARMKITATAAMLALLLAGGCSSSASGGGSAPNPVDIAKMIPSCTLAPGETVGDRDISGNRIARCEIEPTDDPSSSATEQVTVYTYGSNSARDQSIQTQGGSSTDSNKLITGEKFLVVVTGVLNPNTGGVDFYITPQQIADATKGALR